jgi:hypothetical protein
MVTTDSCTKHKYNHGYKVVGMNPKPVTKMLTRPHPHNL